MAGIEPDRAYTVDDLVAEFRWALERLVNECSNEYGVTRETGREFDRTLIRLLKILRVNPNHL